MPDWTFRTKRYEVRYYSTDVLAFATIRRLPLEPWPIAVAVDVGCTEIPPSRGVPSDRQSYRADYHGSSQAMTSFLEKHKRAPTAKRDDRSTPSCGISGDGGNSRRRQVKLALRSAVQSKAPLLSCGEHMPIGSDFTLPLPIVDPIRSPPYPIPPEPTSSLLLVDAPYRHTGRALSPALLPGRPSRGNSQGYPSA